MRSNVLFIIIIGVLSLFITIPHIDALKTSINTTKEKDIFVARTKETPKKNQLIGTYTTENNRSVKLILGEDGIYSLTIDVCENYLVLSGTYELRDSVLKLHNTSNYHSDLNNNEELTFTIIDDKNLKLDESLVCTTQNTLFVK
jgi:hypothetical protein